MFAPDILKGKKYLVTGGGTGLGKSSTTRLAELGAAVVICGRRQSVLEQSAAEINEKYPGKVQSQVCDIREADAVEQMLERIWSDGPLDGLVNNAAGNFVARSEKLSSKAIDAVLRVVLNGTAYVTFGCGKRWIAEQRRGSVVSIVTTYAWTGSAFVVPSAMAKAGVLAMTRSLAVEWGPKGIRFNAIAPGPFPTPGAWERLLPRADLARQFETRPPLGRTGRHTELADLTAYLLGDFSEFINGEVVTIDGGEWIKGAGQFNFLEQMTEEDWASMEKRK